MPYKLIVPTAPALDAALVEAVAKESREKIPPDTADTSSDAPYVIEEQMRRSERIHVTVIWDRWSHVGPEDRSRIVFAAYEAVSGPGVISTLTSALGLTRADAKKLGAENGVYTSAQRP